MTKGPLADVMVFDIDAGTRVCVEVARRPLTKHLQDQPSPPALAEVVATNAP